MTDDLKHVGLRIKLIRQNLGLSTEKFANQFHEQPPSKGTISKWENGHYLPNNERLKKIANLGNTTVEELLKLPNEITISSEEYNRLKSIEQKYNEIKSLIERS